MGAFEDRYRSAPPEARRGLAASAEAVSSPELPALLRAEKDGSCRVSLLLAVARARTRAALPAVQAMLEELDPEVVAAATLALLVLDPEQPPWELAPTLAGNPSELARLALGKLASLDADKVREAVRDRLGARLAEARRAGVVHAAALGWDGFLPGVLHATWLETDETAAARGAGWLRQKAPESLLVELATLGAFQLPPTTEGARQLVMLANERLSQAFPDPSDRAKKLAELRLHYTKAGTQDALSQSGLWARPKPAAVAPPQAPRRGGLGWLTAIAVVAGLAWWVTRPPPPLGPAVVAAPAAQGPTLATLGEPGSRVSLEGIVIRRFSDQAVVLRHDGGRGVMAIFAESAPLWIAPGRRLRLVGTLRGYTRDPGSPAVVDATGAERR